MKPILHSIFLLMLFLSACAAPQPTIDPAQSTMPALTDPSQPISVNAGEVFMIVVESNPSTGYHWEIVGDLNENVVRFISREYTAAEPVMPGSSGVDVWTFEAVSAGETTIALGSFPPGVNAGEGEPEQMITFTIAGK